MLDPRTLLDHADRLLGLLHPTEADIRRAVSAVYYALFHRLTLSAAQQAAPQQGAAIRARICRSMDHRDVRKLCNAIIAVRPAVPQQMVGLVPSPLSRELLNVASAFGVLQDARQKADYDLAVSHTLKEAEFLRELAHESLNDWDDIETVEASRVFLLAMLLADRWTRRT